MDLEKDQVNYVRLIYLLNVVSLKAVRFVFNREIHPKKLKEHLNKSRRKLQGKKQFISTPQWNLIYPSYGEPDPDSEKFDITLMVFLLRHLTDIGICDELPLHRDKSEGEAISILKFYRNKYSHTSNGSVAEEVYSNLVQDIVENICVLEPSLKSDCDEFSELRRTDPTLYEQLQKQVMSMMFIKQMSEGNKSKDTISLRSPLHKACREGNEEKVVSILEITSDYEFINKDDIHGWTLLHVACMMQNTNMVNLLLTKHADINKITNTGATPLYIASFYGRNEIVEILISNRADINKCNLNGFSPLHISCYFGYKAICTTLLHTGSDKNGEDNDHETPLSIACEMGHCELVDLLLENEVRLKKKNRDGNAPIHIACIKGHSKIVERMISINQSIVNLPNIKGSTPLHLSCQKGPLELVKVLLKNNALLSLTDEDNCVPFFIACLNGRTEIVEEILNLQNGPRVNEYFQNELVPLHVACSYEHQELTEALLNWKDIEVEIRDINGMTALYMACQSNNIKN
ncbi:uncharacterized protein LOC143078512 [Mytilus galloprovincialis]|uniref:uncharacterized protein LOC143078512 n=1 Tax=Mytilus galloprovincialis TaxID=29158 RepID=UPI003F7C993E